MEHLPFTKKDKNSNEKENDGSNVASGGSSGDVSISNGFSFISSFFNDKMWWKKDPEKESKIG